MVVAGILERGWDVCLRKDLDVKGNFDYIGLSLNSTLDLLNWGELGKYFKGVNENTIIIVGGPVSQCPELVFRYLDCDAVVIGEGEVPSDMLVQGYKLNEIDGIAYKENDEIIINPPKDPPSIVNRSLPKIPQDIGKQDIRGANVYIETHRGCIFNCAFCQVHSFFGRKIRSRSIDNIVEEVEAFKIAGARRIAISGGTSSLYGYEGDKRINSAAFIELLEKISQKMGKNNLSVPDIRVDMINEEILDAIRRYTIGWVFLGIESGSERILRLMKKGLKVKDIISGVEMAKETGIKVAGSFIVGYPSEEEEDYEMTRDLVEDLLLDDCFVSIAEPIPGTELGEEVVKMNVQDNPLFMKSKKTNLSVAEERAFDLMLTSYVAREKPLILTDDLYSNTLKEVKTQGENIRKVTEIVSNSQA
jgi:B12-binding domain/radical SAM domain protein